MLGSVLVLSREIDHDVRDRHVEAGTNGVGYPTLEPVRPTLRMSRDDDLVGMESSHGILDRDERITVSDLSPGLYPHRSETLERRAEPLLGLCPCRILV